MAALMTPSLPPCSAGLLNFKDVWRVIGQTVTVISTIPYADWNHFDVKPSSKTEVVVVRSADVEVAEIVTATYNKEVNPLEANADTKIVFLLGFTPTLRFLMPPLPHHFTSENILIIHTLHNTLRTVTRPTRTSENENINAYDKGASEPEPVLAVAALPTVTDCNIHPEIQNVHHLFHTVTVTETVGPSAMTQSGTVTVGGHW